MFRFFANLYMKRFLKVRWDGYQYKQGDIVFFGKIKSKVCGISLKPLATSTKVYIIKTCGTNEYTTVYESELRR